jgi:hypothetical protein
MALDEDFGQDSRNKGLVFMHVRVNGTLKR